MVKIVSRSSELESPSKSMLHDTKSGRPVRRSAGKVRRIAGYVDSQIIEDDSDVPSESESSDEEPQPSPVDGKRKRDRKRRPWTPSPPPPPLEPIIRDDLSDELTDEGADSSATGQESPISLQFNVPLGFHGPLRVSLDRSLLKEKKNYVARDMTSGSRRKPVTSVSTVKVGWKTFTDLPAELRNKVYRLLFVYPLTLCFPPSVEEKSSLCRSAQFLRTCRLVHTEGCSVLYGENIFFFERNKSTRGTFWEAVPKEIGYSDVRRFLKMIGPENLTYLRNIWIYLEDACPSSTPYLVHEQRRYINDEHLLDCLRILRQARLREITISFGGRRSIWGAEAKFISYLEKIKADKAKKEGPPASRWYPSKIGDYTWEMIAKKMERQKKLYAEP